MSESKFWDEAARIVFVSIVEKFFNSQEDLSNRDIADIILKQDLDGIQKLVRDTYASAMLDLKSPKTAASIAFVLATYLNSLKLNNGKRNDSFSIRRWMHEYQKDSMLFITLPNALDAELRPLQAAWFEIVINNLLSQGQTTQHKTWIILDELATIQRIPSLAKGLSVARSYGGCFVLGIQNIAQMKEIYGSNATQDISSECNTRCIFRTNDPDTARWVSDNIGQSETNEYMEGLSYGANEMRDGVTLNKHSKLKQVVLPAEIQNLPRLELYLKMSGYPVTKTKIQYKQRKNIAKGFLQREDINMTNSSVVEEIGGNMSDLSKEYDTIPEDNNDRNNDIF